MVDELPEENGQDKRVEWRARMGVAVDLRAGTPRWRTVRMTNLSLKGFRVSGAGSVKVGERVLIRFGGLAPMAGEIRWVLEHEIGCRFAQPLSPYVFDHIIQTLQAADSRS